MLERFNWFQYNTFIYKPRMNNWIPIPKYTQVGNKQYSIDNLH